MAWLKITFDPTQAGEAFCTRFPKRGHYKARGQWVVFDKDAGYKWTDGPPRKVLFAAARIEDCHAFLDSDRTDQGPQLVIPGAERSAHQAMQGREAEGHGRIRARKPQQDPGGLFAPREPDQPGFDWEG